MRRHIVDWCRRNPRKTAILFGAGVFAASLGAAYTVSNVIMLIQGRFEDYSVVYNVVRSTGAITAYLGTAVLGLKVGLNLGKKIYLQNGIQS